MLTFGPTVAVMRVAGTQDLLGGYSPINWTSPTPPAIMKTDRCFVLSFKNSNIENAILSDVVDSNGGVFHSRINGISFGKDYDELVLCTGYAGMAFNEKNGCCCLYSPRSGYCRAIYSYS